MTTLGTQITRMLADRGVDTIFGIPGVHNIEMYRGFEGSGIGHVLARHEQGCGFMADGYARATGKPGVAFVITGPGVTNIMTPMGQAYSDSVPMLVISSCLNPGDLSTERGRLHEMNDQEIAASCVTAWSRTALDASAAYDLIDRALTEMTSERGRPRHIQIPIDVLGAEAPDFPAAAGPMAAIGVQPAEVAKVADLLSIARRPLFVFGGGAVAAKDIETLLARSGAASFTTYAGKGVVPPGSPLHFGSYLARPGSADVFAQADLVLAIGTVLSEVDLWRDMPGHSAPLVRVDIDAGSLWDRQRADYPIKADAAEFLKALTDASPDAPGDTDWRADEVAGTRDRWRAEIDGERPGVATAALMLQAALPDDAVIFSDMTQIAYVGKEVCDVTRPGSWHHPCGFGTLGYALPAAIGAVAADAGRPVVALAGDYGFQYTVNELATATDLAKPLPIIVWDNERLQEIDDCMIGAQVAPFATVAPGPNLKHLAAAYGTAFAAPSDGEALKEALADALAHPGPTLIHLTPALVG